MMVTRAAAVLVMLTRTEGVFSDIDKDSGCI